MMLHPSMRPSVTRNVSSITGRIAGKMDSLVDKSTKIWEYVRDLPYDIFGITTSNIDSLTDGKPLTCYGKSLLQASMLESAGIPWRFEISSCPSHNVGETICGIGNLLVTTLFNKFPGMF
jgi:transglutaminase-like putative cysteine protease